MEEPRLNRLSIVLDEFNLDQIELAAILKVSKDTVSRWCRNANQPKLSDLYNIAKTFRIDIRRLIEPTDWSSETGTSAVQEYLEKKRLNKISTIKKNNSKLRTNKNHRTS
jgi:transcriptional regulator with XRE-family HTH domain